MDATIDEVRPGASRRTGMADEIVASSVELVRRAGFREYFDPLDGTGHGIVRFSWKAALLTDMVLASRRSRTLATTDRVGDRTRT